MIRWYNYKWFLKLVNKDSLMNNKTKGALYMILSACSFSLMQIMIALTADDVPLFEQLFFRNFFAGIIAFYGIKKNNSKVFGSKENRGWLILRCSAGFLGMITLFYASSHGVQADITVLSKMSPFVISILAVLFLKEKMTKYQLVGLLLSFIGAYFVANPKFNSDVFPLLVALSSSVFAGVAYFSISSLKGKEHPSTIVFAFALTSTVISFFMMLPVFVIPSVIDSLLLVLLGVFAAMGQLCLTKAYSVSNASEVSIYNYTSILFASIFGYVFLSQKIALNAIAGAMLVLFASLIVYWGGKKNTPSLNKAKID